MVDLPSIPDRIPQVNAPQPRVSPGQAAQPYMELADSLDQASKEVGGYAQRQAEEAGRTAVTRDADGNVKVERPFIVGNAALAYEHGVKVAAVTDGENVIRTDLQTMRRKFDNDPAGFLKASQTYTQEKVGQYRQAAGAEVGLTLGRIAQDTAREYHEGLLNQKERRDLANAKASIEAQIETTKNELFAIASGGDTDSPDVKSRLQKIGALYGQLTGNPKFGVQAATVNYELGQFKSEMDVAALGHRLETVQKEKGTEAAMEQADKIRTDPSLNLTPAQRFTYYSRLVTGINARERAEKVINKQTSDEIDEVGKLAANGFSATPEKIATLRQTVAESKSPELTEKLRNVETTLPIIADWRKSSPAQLERDLSELDRTMREGGATPSMIALRDTGQKMLKSMREGIEKDPLGWANRTGAVPISPINWADPQQAPLQMRDRAARAETVAAHYGITPSYLTPDETAALQSASSRGGTDMLNVARTLVDGFGDRAPKVLSELGKDSPVLAHLGGLMTANGSPAVIRDAAEAVRLRQDKDFKLPGWFNKERDKVLGAQTNETASVYGNAFFLNPDTGRAAQATAEAAFFARAVRNAHDPELLDSTSKAAWDKALQESAGATFDPKGNQYGGIATYQTRGGALFLFHVDNRVVIPPNIKTGEFDSVIGALRDEDVKGAVAANGKPYTARDIRAAVPVAVKGGYRFSVGDPTSDSPKWIRGADGKPFVLDLESLEPVLRQRVPDAYAGGR